ncbi:DUF2141 domain-containing protein [Brevundimonas aurifodinae]|uniref:DUF2141 domain-containing protein n=2 Tax=Brevundimonas TaxID=41275 RepID=A0ABV1NII7_9CAUL|nr:MAG: hypothetical protein B7Z42_04305 [Brevundimonas sp. 12-68-7]OYX35711.1 MAG: hypothetical protein B7Z01_02125 [Brevundimonas subvibrioides]
MIRTLSLIAALSLGVAAPVLAEPTGALTVTFEPAAQTGAVMVALYDASTYSGGQPIRGARIDVAAGQRTASFEGLEPGEYGIKAFHDVNGNGRMDANPFGMPTEPYAFSNNAVGNMGPAGWDRARFIVQGDTTQTISIR